MRNITLYLVLWFLCTGNILCSAQVITLHIAVQQGDLNKVTELVDAGTDVNLRDRFGNTCLTIAAWNGYLDIMKYLVDHGANINAMDNHQYTPIMLAASKGNLDMVQYCIQQGAVVDEQGFMGRSALMNACIGHAGMVNNEVIKTLAINSGDINAKDNSGKTALDYASTDDVRQILVAAGALKSSDLK
jgi:ankyrin repeat protein